MPDELLVLILERLSTPQRIAARAVSRRWRDAIDATPHLWRCDQLEYRSRIVFEFQDRCQDGDLARAQWLVKMFGLTADDARADSCDCFFYTCLAGTRLLRHG